jgi:hypothetical protein
MLSPRLLDLLRDYWKAVRPGHILFTGATPDQPITTESIKKVCQRARVAAGLGKLVTARMAKVGADLCIVVHRNLIASVNTKDCAAQAIAAGVLTYLIESDEGVPVKLEAGDPRIGRSRIGR